MKHHRPNLARIRRRLGMTQEELALSAATTQRNVSYIESGRHKPKEETARSIYLALVSRDKRLAFTDLWPVRYMVSR